MRRRDDVTFGGGGLDRLAERRDEIDALRADPTTRILPVWRGKPLILADDEGTHDRAGSIGPDHALLEFAGPSVLLGRSKGVIWMAVDVSDWVPSEDLPETLGAFADPSVQHHPDLPPGMAFRELRAAMTRLDPAGAELCVTARAALEWHRTHPYCARCGEATLVDRGGWQRKCPACGGTHFPRTDPVVIMLVTHGNDLLIGRSPHWPDRMYSLLAGFVEPGETVEAAVRREVMEETRVTVGDVRYLASQPWPFPASLMIGCHGLATSREITADPVEIEDATWISREDLAQVFAGTHPDIAQPRQGAIAQHLMSRWLADTLD